MAEELRVNRTIESGRVDTGRPGPTGLSELSRALGRFGDLGQSGLNFAVRQAKKEEQEVFDALSSPLATDEEAKEIGDAARFPLARLRAQNRRGELIVQQSVPEIQDILAKTPDPIEARKALRILQAQLLEDVTDSAVAAGIREKMAMVAQPLLAEASKRRQIEAVRKEELVVDDTLSNAFQYGGPKGFTEEVYSQIELEVSTGGDVKGLMSRTHDILEAQWRSGDDEGPGNAMADEVLSTIDQLRKAISLSSGDDLKLTTLRDRIQSAEETARRADASDGKTSRTEIHAGSFNRLVDFTVESPGLPLPPSYVKEARETANTPAAREKVEKFVRDHSAGQGALLTPEAAEGEKLLREQWKLRTRSINGVAEVLHPEALSTAIQLYQTAMSRLSPDMDPAELRQESFKLQDFVMREAVDIHKERAARLDSLDDFRNATQTKIEAARASQDEAKEAEARAQYNDMVESLTPSIIEREVVDHFSRTGTPFFDFDNPF